MKLAKICVAALVTAGAMGAFADAANVLISFSTKAPEGAYRGDTYADGKTVVLDGEWYALVWSADGKFEGIRTDCKPVDPNDAVVLCAPLAKGGHCPFTVFQIDSKSANAKSSGTYAVYLLDTRSADGKSVAAKNAQGLPVLLNGAAVASAYAAAAAVDGGAVVRSVSEGLAWGESTVADGAQPVIKAFNVGADKVSISVEGLLPGVKYNVKMGAEVGKLQNYALDVPKIVDDGKTTFEINKSDDRFFSVVREPLAK